MRILGVSALDHDAAVSVVSDGQITFAAHAERYSRIKNDPHLNADLLADALRDGPPDVICWYERPWRKKLRQLLDGQWREMRTPGPRAYLAEFGLRQVPIRYYGHHFTHATAGYFTSPFREACVVVTDAINTTIWNAIGRRLTLIWQQAYPQKITEPDLINLVSLASELTGSDNLVLAGSVALNCATNTKIAQRCGFRHLWIMPNPGDAGSSLGAALAYHGKHIVWDTPFLGHEIDRGLNLLGIIEALEAGKVVGVANGRAEFGPRALGNRSLLADPRGNEIKDKVNRIKQRESHPFAPAIVGYMVDAYYEMPVERSPYMQFIAQCRTPEKYPAICHADGTSRVQTVTRKDNANLHDLLCMWHWRTGCPMLLNTSLNAKGEPMVNSWADAEHFAKTYDVPVF